MPRFGDVVTQPVVEFFYLYEFAYRNVNPGPTEEALKYLRFTNVPGGYSWNGNTFHSAGGDAGHQEISESADERTQSVGVFLTLKDTAIVHTILDEWFRGQPASIWIVFRNNDGTFTAPHLVFSGFQVHDYTVEETREETGRWYSVSTEISSPFSGIPMRRPVRSNVPSHNQMLRRAGEKPLARKSWNFLYNKRGTEADFSTGSGDGRFSFFVGDSIATQWNNSITRVFVTRPLPESVEYSEFGSVFDRLNYGDVFRLSGGGWTMKAKITGRERIGPDNSPNAYWAFDLTVEEISTDSTVLPSASPGSNLTLTFETYHGATARVSTFDDTFFHRTSVLSEEILYWGNATPVGSRRSLRGGPSTAGGTRTEGGEDDRLF